MLDHRLLLEEAQHDLLAVDGRQRGHPEVDLAPVDAGGEAPVLGQAPLGDVEARDDLEPRHHGEVERARHLEQVEQQAVDAVADPRAVLVRLHVDVGGAVARGPAQDVVHDLDDGRVVGLGAELLDVDEILGRRRDADVEAEILPERLVEALGGDHPPVRLIDGLLDGAAWPDAEVHVEAGGPAEVVEADHVQGIRGGHDELAPVPLDGDDPVLARHLLRHQLDHVQVDPGQVLARDRLLPELLAEVLEQDLLVDEPHLEQDLPEAVAGLALAVEGGGELLVAQDAVVDEHLAQGEPAIGRMAHRRASMSARRARARSRSGCVAGALAMKAR